MVKQVNGGWVKTRSTHILKFFVVSEVIDFNLFNRLVELQILDCKSKLQIHQRTLTIQIPDSHYEEKILKRST